MSVFKKQSLIESFPAYDVFVREGRQDYASGEFATEITADDTLGLRVTTRSGKTFYRTYSPGSVVSYALEYNNDPAVAYTDALERGHPTHWINQNSTCLTSHQQAKQSLVKVEVGMKVRFEGRYFTIESAPNDNLKLVAI